jgi:hypothetical protein
LITLADTRAVALARAGQSVLSNHILHAVLFLTIASSFFVFVQPSPYEGLIAVLALVCVIAPTSIDRLLIPLILLAAIMIAAASSAVFKVLDTYKAVQFYGITVYLQLTGIVFACIFTSDCARRLDVARSAYIFAATIASVIGIIGYFQMFPGAEYYFTMDNRVSSTFKDPNAFGPFLVPPLLMIMERFITERMRWHQLIAILIIFVALLLSFSRGAVGNFAAAAVVMLLFLYVTATGPRVRMRIVLLLVIGGTVGVLVFTALLSVDEIAKMISERAVLLESYDTGTSGARFNVQLDALRLLLDYPNGMGPLVFSYINDLVAHNSYLDTALNYGWLGGIAYTTQVTLTLFLGFRMMFIRTPWQSTFIVCHAAFLGLALEAFIVETDHTRQHYLLMGAIWGLSAASARYIRGQYKAPSDTPVPP